MRNVAEQRKGDRRSSRAAFRFPDRRSGFDRRAVAGVVAWYRDRPRLIATALAAIVLLNVADFVLTLHALELGAREANPVMAGLLDRGPALAGAIKLLLAVAVAAVIWRMRRYRRILEVSLVAMAAFTLLIAYQISLILGAA
jgi:hypothetical protein